MGISSIHRPLLPLGDAGEAEGLRERGGLLGSITFTPKVTFFRVVRVVHMPDGREPGEKTQTHTGDSNPEPLGSETAWPLSTGSTVVWPRSHHAFLIIMMKYIHLTACVIIKRWVNVYCWHQNSPIGLVHFRFPHIWIFTFIPWWVRNERNLVVSSSALKYI